jgi:acetyl-CoA carboxylase, biotin carboxylase subunit
MSIRRILIANRGEIAARVIRTCQVLGIETVLAASEVDKDSRPARMADRTLCIGPAHPSDSYLKVDTIVQAAMGVKADAVHPGYGFLSERADLARACEEQGMTFIGPASAQIEAVGDKLHARDEAQAAGVPTLPGRPVGTVGDAMRLGREIGPPLLIKAVGGGGGRGMKRIEHLDDLPAAMELATAEASSAFGDARVYLERFVEHGRHVEVQILGDGNGAVIHLGERDCSVQRRYQKLIEETPAPLLSDDLRARIQKAGVRFAQRLSYRSAGTVEFLVDPERDAFYFLEMNARIQVEHPVTEAVTGVDLIAEQIRIAEGRGLSLKQEQVQWEGCAIECRINAEDPAEDFRPSPGTVRLAIWPSGEGVRVDTHIFSGARIPPFYDSLMAKIIAYGPDRSSALGRLRCAISQTKIEGVANNLPFHASVLADPEFVRGGVNTSYLSRFLQSQRLAQGSITHA